MDLAEVEKRGPALGGVQGLGFGRRRIAAQYKRDARTEEPGRQGEFLQEGGGSGGCGLARRHYSRASARSAIKGVGKQAIGGRQSADSRRQLESKVNEKSGRQPAPAAPKKKYGKRREGVGRKKKTKAAGAGAG